MKGYKWTVTFFRIFINNWVLMNFVKEYVNTVCGLS